MGHDWCKSGEYGGGKTFQFSADMAAAMAVFIAELTRQGIEYNVVNLAGGWNIEVTGC